MTSDTEDLPPAQDQPGPVTRFFEPVAETMISIGDLAESSLRYGVALGGAAILAKAIYSSSFGVPLIDIARPGSVRAILGMVCAGMAIGVVRVVHGWRTMAGSRAGAVSSSPAYGIGPASSPGMSAAMSHHAEGD